MTRSLRPDFLIAGTMKSGTTTLFRWLESHPEIWLPAVKEPNHFSRAGANERTSSYLQLFAGCPSGKKTGEASVEYTDPLYARMAAEGAAMALPDARIVILLREPLSRMRSHYGHEVLRGRERRSFVEALDDPSSPYVRRSCYAHAVEPWLSLFRTRVFIAKSEEMFSPSAESWWRLLDFLDISRMRRPDRIHNVAADKVAFTRPLLWCWERGLFQALAGRKVPGRRLARAAFTRPQSSLAHLLSTADSPVPDWATERIRADLAELADLVPDLVQDGFPACW